MSFMENPIYQFSVKSLLAGFLIGLGCVVYVVCPVKYIGSFLFSLGLMTIIINQYNLYTGKVGAWVPRATLSLLYMFALNGIACAATAYCFAEYTRLDFSAIETIVPAKVNDTMLSSFILAIGCGAMMQIAFFNFLKERHPIYIVLPIMFFMLAGFEHSVANCGFFAIYKLEMTQDVWIRLGVIMLGNGVGAWILTKFLPKTEHYINRVPSFMGTLLTLAAPQINQQAQQNKPQITNSKSSSKADPKNRRI